MLDRASVATRIAHAYWELCLHETHVVDSAVLLKNWFFDLVPVEADRCFCVRRWLCWFKREPGEQESWTQEMKRDGNRRETWTKPTMPSVIASITRVRACECCATPEALQPTSLQHDREMTQAPSQAERFDESTRIRRRPDQDLM